MDPVGPREIAIQATRKTAAYGANALVLSLSVLACLIFGNILLSKYHKRWDVTERKIHSLSPQTLRILGDLKTDVKVMAFLEDGPKNKGKTRDL
ncbi:MAG: hypothetical protein HYU64_20180, partial [Armatimonadetes bacterium]|nr:hypothetical protein [Armatimonadota bacterium]